MTSFRYPALVDIIIPGYGDEALTRRCLESIWRNTPSPSYRVIYVDNGTPWFAGLVSSFANTTQFVPVGLGRNHGYCRAVNVGMALSRVGEANYVVWLNNDTEVPEADTGWLERLIEPFRDETVGAVGAVTDRVYGYQRRTPGSAQYSLGINRRESDALLLIGFAMALRQTACVQVGWLDERFEPGNFEDVDYSLRLRQAGWRLKIAETVWLHHKMHAAFGDSLGEVLRDNRIKFIEKWGWQRLNEMGVSP